MDNRREVTSRDTKFANRAALWLANMNISPNTISVLSIVFSVLTLISFYLDSVNYLNHLIAMVLAVVGVQGRLIPSLFSVLVCWSQNISLEWIWHILPSYFQHLQPTFAR